MVYKLENLSLRFGELAVFDGFSIAFKEGSATAVLGSSGCGKTSLLLSLAGLSQAAQAGREDFEGLRFGFAFQEPRLLPWRSAVDNVALVLEGAMDRKRARERAAQFLAAVGLGADLDKRPGQLSGGMRQRVSLARAFAYPSEILLMDEPFQSVDPRTRSGLIEAFLALERSERRTVVLVTHDIGEALRLGDRVVALGGRPATIVADLEPRARLASGSSLPELETELYGLAFAESR